MKKTLILAAAFACAAFTANAANVFESTWSTWTNAYQSSYNAGNGTLIADAGSTGGTVFGVSGGNANMMGPAAFLGNAFYSFDKEPSFTFSNNDTWSGVSQLILKITYGGVSQEDTLASLVYNGGSAVAKLAAFSEAPATGGQDAGNFVNVYTWDIASGIDLSSFAISLDVVGKHTAFASFEVTAVSAVPEPSTYALIAGAFGLAAVVIARRRRA